MATTTVLETRDMSFPVDIPLVVLAGGLASRLKDLSTETPKYLMPIGNDSVFADYHLAWAKDQGFQKVYLCIGHLGSQIRKYCGDGKRYGLEISYADEGDFPRGTGGALRLLPKDKMPRGIALTYGDTILSLSSEDILNTAIREKAYALMTVFRNTVSGHVNNANCSTIAFPGAFSRHFMSQIRYSKSNPQPKWQHIDYGYLYLSQQFLADLHQYPPGKPSIDKFDLAQPLEEASEKGLLAGYEVKERFWEIGSPEALEEFRKKFHPALK